MKRKLLIAVPIVAVWAGLVAMALRDASPGAGGPGGQAASATVASESEERVAVRLEPGLPSRRAGAGAASDGTHSTRRFGVSARAQQIADSAEFTGFVKTARLDTEQQHTLTRILALHYENERTLAATATDPELLSSMQRQLLHDTWVQLRGRVGMSDAAWENFERSGLLASPARQGSGDPPNPKENPT